MIKSQEDFIFTSKCLSRIWTHKYNYTTNFIVYISCGLAINNFLIPALIEHWCLDYQPLYSTVEQSSDHTVLKLLPDHHI